MAILPLFQSQAHLPAGNPVNEGAVPGQAMRQQTRCIRYAFPQRLAAFKFLLTTSGVDPVTKAE